MEKHPTTNIQHPTPKTTREGCALDVGRSMLDVGCYPIAQNWLLLNSGPCPSAFNMALDEALLEAMPRLQQPVLRFYGWAEPAATFGYFQKFSEVGRATLLRPLIRRPTGGGLVPHDADWTYSLVFPAGHEWHSLRAVESYRRVHEWIRAAFAELKIETELASGCKKTRPGQCFAGHEKFDLLWRGKKIAGAAQRRNRLGLLIQGSVQPPPLSLARADWEKAMRDVAQTEFHVTWSGSPPDAALRARADSLASQKFALDSHNRKR
jgi:lipoyl(octanoyl) transferase